MPMMKALSHKVVRSKSGHSIKFEPNKPAYVPPEAVVDAQAIGAVMCEDDGSVNEELAGRQVFEVSAELRRSIITKIMLAIAERNDPADFDAGGRPKIEAIYNRSNLKTTAQEVDELFTVIRKARDEKMTIEFHPNTDIAMEALLSDNRTELQALAKKYVRKVDGEGKETGKGLTKNDLKKFDQMPLPEAKIKLVGLLAGLSFDNAGD